MYPMDFFFSAYGLTESVISTKTEDTEEPIVEGTIPMSGVTIQIRDVGSGKILDKKQNGMIVTKSKWVGISKSMWKTKTKFNYYLFNIDLFFTL